MALLALGTPVAGCGGGDDEPTSDDPPAAQVEAAIRDAWDEYAAADDSSAAANDYCDAMTSVYQQIQVAAAPGDASTCPEAVAAASRAWHKRGYKDLPIKFFSIKVKGKVALVKTTGGILGHQTYRLRLVNEDGSWKLPVDALKPIDG